MALTFDAEHPDRSHCPPGTHERVLEILDDAGARSTFFLQGRWASAYPETARRIAGAGHLIGNHSDHHAHVTEFSDDGLRADVSAAEDDHPRRRRRRSRGPGSAARSATDTTTPGSSPSSSELGYRNVHWDVEAFDWEGDRSVDVVTRTVLDGVAAHGDGAIVLFHTWPETTPQALVQVLGRLRGDGAVFVTVDEVLA